MEENWVSFYSYCLKFLENHIPAKLSSTRSNLGMVNHIIAVLDQRIYNKAKKYHQLEVWSEYM